MFTSPIQDILTARLQPLPELVMATNLRHDIDDLVAQFIPSGKIAVIDDARTSTACGDLVYRALKGRFEATHIMLPHAVQADEETLAGIEHKSRSADMLIAVGSGTINDLVKLASYKAGKPYIVFPTAASMNGYVSRNASITMHGHKQSLPAHLPMAVLVDMQVICNAPLRLTQAGLGDCLARPTAQADWLLSHHLLGIAYDAAPYQLIAPYEAPVFEQAGALPHGDMEVMQALMKLLLLSGFGMSIAGSSLPASGAEHMIAHAYGMSHAESRRENLHGEEIALTSIHMAARQQHLLESLTPPLLHAPMWDENIQRHFDPETIASFKPLYDKKAAAIAEKLPNRRMDMAQWERAREAIATIHIAPEKLSKISAQASLPDSPLKLGWNAQDYADITSAARFTRDRFTCLDLG